MDVVASSLAPSRLAGSRGSCYLAERFPDGGGDGQWISRCSEKATTAPNIL